MAKLTSIFTDDLGKCIVTGMETGIEVHHVFGGRMGLRKRSSELGFVAPLHFSVHPNGAYCADRNWMELDHWLKRKCQEYFIEIQGHTRQEWYDIFGRFYDERCNERVWLNGKFEWKL